MPAVVGVDAGGSRTVAVAAEGERTGEPFESGAANAATLGVEHAAKEIAEAAEGALRGASPAAVYAGVAGAWDTGIAQALHDELAARFQSARIGVGSDVEIALRAGAPNGDALLLLAGTGSIAYGEVNGERLRRGGLGAAIGDEGSGYAIGIGAVRQLARALDGRAPMDEMLEAVAEKLGVETAVELAASVRGAGGVPLVASLAELAIARAGEGDRTAAKLVQAAALDLFELLRSLVRAANAGGREMPLVLAGGLLRENSLLTYLLETRVANEYPQVHIIKGVPPYLGALAAARRLATS